MISIPLLMLALSALQTCARWSSILIMKYMNKTYCIFGFYYTYVEKMCNNILNIPCYEIRIGYGDGKDSNLHGRRGKEKNDISRRWEWWFLPKLEAQRRRLCDAEEGEKLRSVLVQIINKISKYQQCTAKDCKMQIKKHL